MMAPTRVAAAVVLGLIAVLAVPVMAALKGHGGAVTGIAVTPDGARVISAGFDYSLMLWDLAASRRPRRLEGHEAAVAAVAMFPDGRHAVSGSDDGTVGYWDLTADRLIARWPGHQGKVAAVAVVPDGSLVASGGWDRGLRLWDPATGDSRLFEGHSAAINAVAIASDGRLIASGDHDGHILLWAVPEGRLLDAIAGNGFAVNALLFTAEGGLLSASADKTVRLWDPVTRRELLRYEGLDEPLVSLALSHDGATVAAGGAGGTIMLRHAADASFIRALYAHQGPVFALAFAPDDRRLWSGGLDGMIRQWDTADWHEVDGERPPVAPAEPAVASRADSPGDHGARLFRTCSACHELSEGQGAKAGPSLYGLFGRKAGEVPGYAYSPALKTSGMVWTDATIDRLFALGPEEVVPGSKMPLQRMPDPKDRADLIEFLARATRPPDPR
jgi:cytochrome c